jgi:L-aspartate oxidase
MARETEILIIGAGIAGCTAALKLAEKKRHVTLLCANDRKSSNSYMAQGGIVYKGKGDSKELLAKDISDAGAGLCYPKAVDFIADKGPQFVKEILVDELKVPFDSNENILSLTEEGAHSLARILHHKDSSGEAIMNSLLEALESSPYVELLENYTAVDLMTLAHQSLNPLHVYEKPTCIGAYVLNNKSLKIESILARETILATGGIGDLYLHTTNPQGANGSGIAMGYRAGVRIMNMEYVQFHPTTLYVPNDPKRFLLSEALRGEGAVLLSNKLQSFMKGKDPQGDLASRDVVARSIYQEMLKTSSDHVWLEFQGKSSGWVQDRFPKIYNYCLDKGYDLETSKVPVVPAAHYLCGGISADLEGRTTIHRLRAIGEVACTGVHGANRLASVSLLEGVTWGCSCAESIDERLLKEKDCLAKVAPWKMEGSSIDPSLVKQDWITIKQTMWNYVGLIRDRRRLKRAQIMLKELSQEIDFFYAKAKLTPEILSLRNGVLTASLITQGAMLNLNSKGCHFRVD